MKRVRFSCIDSPQYFLVILFTINNPAFHVLALTSYDNYMSGWKKKSLITLLVVIPTALWLLWPSTQSFLQDQEDGGNTMLCQWAISDGASGISVIDEGDPTRMSVEELVGSGLAYSYEARKSVQCQPAGMGLAPATTPPDSSGSSMLVQRSND